MILLSILDLYGLLDRIGNAILLNLAEGALVWIGYKLLISLNHNHITYHYKIAIGAEFIIFLAFICNLFLVHTGDLNIQQPSWGMEGTSTTWEHFKFALPQILAELYLIILFIAFLKQATSNIMFGQVKRHLEKEKSIEKWDCFVKTISRQMRIKRPVTLVHSNQVKGPMTFGWLKPIIVFPIASLTDLDVYQLEALLIHELAHIKRYDFLVHNIENFLSSLLWFNPFLHLLQQESSIQREKCCDSWVLHYGYHPFSYATALYKLASIALGRSPQVTNALAASAKNTGQLHARIKNILGKEEEKKEGLLRFRRIIISWGMTLFIILCSGLFFYPTKINPTKISSTNTTSTYQTIKRSERAIPIIHLIPVDEKNAPSTILTRARNKKNKETIIKTSSIKQDDRSNQDVTTKAALSFDSTETKINTASNKSLLQLENLIIKTRKELLENKDILNQQVYLGCFTYLTIALNTLENNKSTINNIFTEVNVNTKDIRIRNILQELQNNVLRMKIGIETIIHLNNLTSKDSAYSIPQKMQ